MTADDRLLSATGPFEGSAAAALCEAFVKVPGVGIALVSGKGEILYENEEIRKMYLDAPQGGFVGRRIPELFPPDWAQERLRLLQRVVSTGQGLALREVWRGRQILATMRPIPSEGGEDPVVLIISRPTEGSDPLSTLDGFEVVESAFVELGDLSALTPRELVVLSLLGQGLTLKEIAATLHRSFKTVDNHRSAIGRKLNQTDRLMLARLAAQAGLRVDDAHLERVKFKPPST
ncbi:MAG: hypothetical protein DYG94_13940 [Leptolyngbya sp. PLA3]|nr:MAG: hypothetical protein EDM82_14495 [Cyanobacteria bacterium CYA]MCE7969829.1 hypothetical protein [Leptolyngbya sp. PL-A3]